MRVTVQPASDGYDMRGNWVTKRGGKSEPSTKKSAAIRKARKMANQGDTIVVKGTDGRVLSGYPRRYRGDYSTTSPDDSSRLGVRNRDNSRDERPTTVRDVDDDFEEPGAFSFHEPVEGDLLDDDFDNNKKNTESALDDLF